MVGLGWHEGVRRGDLCMQASKHNRTIRCYASRCDGSGAEQSGVRSASILILILFLCFALRLLFPRRRVLSCAATS
jgi:hypothetical protein